MFHLIGSFGQVKHENNWGSWLSLNGTPIKEGTHCVRWSEGDDEFVYVHVKSHTYTISDMGVPCDITDESAYIIVDYKGRAAQLDVVGLTMCRCKEIPSVDVEESNGL